MRTWAACLIAAGTLCLPELARGNGRFPEAQRLLEHPSDSNRLYLAGTYGLLITENRGQSWHYVCEQSFALETLEGDPFLELLHTGDILSGMSDQLTRSEDCGCTWQSVLAQATQLTVIDITTDSADKALALVKDATNFPSQVKLYESTNAGQSWTKTSDLPDISSAYTIDVAPSDPQRLYVSAYSPSMMQGVLLVSKNRGGSWDELVITGTGTTAAPYIAAVHPSEPDTVFVRTRVNDFTADFAAQDALLVTTNAGGDWGEALHRQAMLLGFALSPDGSTVLAGYGDSILAGISTNPDDLGIYKASTSDLVFQQIMNATVTCLRWTPRGVYACTVQDTVQVPTPGMSVGFSADANFTLATANPLTPLLDLRQVQGPLGCAAATCSDSWTTGGTDAGVAVCQQLGASCTFTAGEDITCPVPTPDAGSEPDASAPSDAGTSPDASASGGASGGVAGVGSGGASVGGSGAGNSAGASSSGANGGGPVTSAGTSNATPSADSGKKSGCGCRLAGDSRSGNTDLLLLLGLAAVAKRRRR
jgi:MYXO-CTERM domain-containing protein